MVKNGMNLQEVKSYVPSKWLKSLLDEKLQLLKNNESDRNWDRKKVDTVDKIFQSMADLIYFLEMTAKHSELREIFEKDLEDLLDIRPDSKMQGLSTLLGVQHRGVRLTQTNLTRLIYASLIPHQDDYQNFRLRLLNKLQGIVFEKMWWIMRNKFGSQSQIMDSVVDDMAKCVGWTAMLAGPKEYDKTNQKRIIDFPAVNSS